MTRLSRWLAKSDRFWDRVLGRPASPRPRRIAVEQLEDRVVPDGRPLPVIAVGPEPGGRPFARMFRADTGATLLNLAPFGDAFPGGVRVAVGDLTRDGTPDLITAAGPGGGPHVRVFDGKTGAQLSGPVGSFFAYDPAFAGGVQVAAGDVTGDGYADIATAADSGGGPHVRVFDGRTGAVVANFFAFEPEVRGGVRLAARDFTGDGKAELVLAAGAGGAPRVRVLDPVTLAPIPGPL
ncbi:MAG TPA: VCBS repeat-containing protein, partial [Fimbriiglobus sp.]|nr:VCBS repeat-containing protein [Fimbriiglobus sp.]